MKSQYPFRNFEESHGVGWGLEKLRVRELIPCIPEEMWVIFFLFLVSVAGAQEALEDESPSSGPSRDPAPEFTVYEKNGMPCVLFAIDATILIEPKRTANKGASVKVPKGAISDGRCGLGEDSSILLKWSSFILTFHFQKSRVSDAWYVDLISLSFNSSEKIFEDIGGGSGGVQVIRSDDPLTLFLTPIGRSYSCSFTKDIKLLDEKRSSRVTITLNYIQIQPFAAMTQRQFGDPFNCPEQAGRRDESVPLFVGTMLAVVVLSTIGGYAGYRHFKIKKIQYGTME